MRNVSGGGILLGNQIYKLGGRAMPEERLPRGAEQKVVDRNTETQ